MSEHKIKRTSDAGIIRVACSCGHALSTDNKKLADKWEQDHLLGKKPKRSKRRHERET